MRLFAGDGESNDKGAAEGLAWDRIRTRADLATLINATGNIKKEPVEEVEGTNMDMGEDDDIVYLRSVREREGTSDEDDERANALLDEEDEISVVDTEGEDEEDGEREEEEQGETTEAMDEQSGDVPAQDTVAVGVGTEQGGDVPARDTATVTEQGTGEREKERESDKGEEDGRGGREEEEKGDSDAPVEMDVAGLVGVKHPDAMYKPVQSIRSGSQNPMKLNKRMKYDRGEASGFVMDGDERILRNSNMCSMELKRNTSASFNPDTGKCVTCLNGVHDAWKSRKGGPIAINLSDQHFPPNIPADEAGECIRILRVENGSVTELADELLRICPAGGLPNGSIIFFGSMSQLAVDSVEKYAADWVRNRNWIKDRMGDVMVVPYVPLSASGVEDRVVIRSMIDLAAWFDTLEDPELRLLRNTRKGWEDTYLGKKSRGPGWADYRLNLSMPVSLYQGAGTMPFTTGNWGDRPTGIIGLSETGERHWIGKMVCELNREVGLGLATAWSVGRTMSAVSGRQRVLRLGEL
jgi:hypothetical protein